MKYKKEDEKYLPPLRVVAPQPATTTGASTPSKPLIRLEIMTVLLKIVFKKVFRMIFVSLIK